MFFKVLEGVDVGVEKNELEAVYVETISDEHVIGGVVLAQFDWVALLARLPHPASLQEPPAKMACAAAVYEHLIYLFMVY